MPASVRKSIRSFWRALPFTGEDRPRVNVIELNGVIAPSDGPGRRGLSAARVGPVIEAAFKTEGLKAVALAINSPGGSPVQSRLIHNAVRRAAAKKKIPVLAFIEDVGASGGYILALAGDEIIADKSSIVGSIGVIAAGFGFQDAIARVGVERRVRTAGEHKSILDPFEPEKPEDAARLQAILDDLHTHFIDLVKTRRGDKLNDPGDCFTGAFWTAGPAKERGLIDQEGQLADFLRERFGETVKIRRYSPERGGVFGRLIGGAGVPGGPERLAAALPEAALAAAESRAAWARYGL